MERTSSEEKEKSPRHPSDSNYGNNGAPERKSEMPEGSREERAPSERPDDYNSKDPETTLNTLPLKP